MVKLENTEDQIDKPKGREKLYCGQVAEFNDADDGADRSERDEVGNFSVSFYSGDIEEMEEDCDLEDYQSSIYRGEDDVADTWTVYEGLREGGVVVQLFTRHVLPHLKKWDKVQVRRREVELFVKFGEGFYFFSISDEEVRKTS